MAVNRLELPITATDQSAAGVESAKRQFRSLEQEAAKAAAGASAAFTKQRDAMGRFVGGGGTRAAGPIMGPLVGPLVTDIPKTLAGVDRAITTFERRTSMVGLRGVEKIRAQSALLMQTAGSDERAIQRIIAASNRAEENYRRMAAPKRPIALPITPTVDEIETATARLGRMGDMWSRAGARMMPVSIALGLAAKKSIDASSQIESARVAFTTSMGSEAAADKHIADLQKFARQTPFSFSDLIAQSQYLQAQTFRPDEILPTLQGFGNAVAASGGNTETLNRVISQIGQAKSKGKAQWSDFKLIAEAGVPVVPMLAEGLRKKGDTQEQAQQRVFDAFEKGKLRADATIAYLQNRFLNDPKYKDQLQKQSQTQAGKISNLGDAATQFFAEVGKGMSPTVKKWSDGAASIIDKSKEMVIAFQSLPQPVKDFFVTLGAVGIAAGPMTYFLGTTLPFFLGPTIKGFQLLRGAIMAAWGASLFTAGVQGPLTLAGTRALWLINILKGFTIPMLVGTGVYFFLSWLQRHGATPIDQQTEAIKRLNDEIRNGAKAPLPPEFKGAAEGTAPTPTFAVGPGGTINQAGGVKRLFPAEISNYVRGLKSEPGAGGAPPPRLDLGGGGGDAEAKKQATAARAVRSDLMRARRAMITEEMADLAKEPEPGKLTTQENYLRRNMLAVRRVNEQIDDEILRQKEAGTYNKDVAGKIEERRQVETEAALAKLARDQREDDKKYYRDQWELQGKAAQETRDNAIKAEVEVFEVRTRLRSEYAEEVKRARDEQREFGFEIAQQEAEQQRDLSLQSLEAIQAQTLAAKLNLEDQKLVIEQAYADRSLDIQVRRIAAERAIAIGEITGKATRAGIPLTDPSVDAAVKAVGATYDQQIEAARDTAAVKDIQRARQVSIDKAKLVIDENRRIFDSMKQQAGDLLDAMFSKTQTIGGFIKSALKAAFLTPLKDAASSQIAAAMTRMVTGNSVALEPATVTGTGPIAGMRRVMARLGVGAQPRFGGGGIDDVRLVNNSVPVFITNPGVQSNAAREATPAAQAAAVRTGGIVGKVAAGAAAGGILGAIFGGRGGGGAVGAVTGTANTATVDYGGGAKDIVSWAGGADNPALALGPGGTAGFAGPMGITRGEWGPGGLPLPGPMGGAAGGGRLGMLGNLLSVGKNPLGFLRALGGIGAGNPLDAAQNAARGTKGLDVFFGIKGGKVPGGAPGVQGAMGGAMLLGGAALAMHGWSRGGWGGALEMGAGGALIGAKFGGPMGALVGGAIGFGVGAVKAMFFKSAEEKAKNKIRDMYGLDVKDKGILKQITGIAKQSFGGNLDVAIRSPQIRDLLELYAMSTGQSFGGGNAKMRPVSLVQTGSGLSQEALYDNGRALAHAGLASRTSADIISSNPGGTGQPTNYGGGQMPVTVVAKLDGPATTALLRGEAVETIQANPRTVQAATTNAGRGDYQRMETVKNATNPGLLLS